MYTHIWCYSKLGAANYESSCDGGGWGREDEPDTCMHLSQVLMWGEIHLVVALQPAIGFPSKWQMGDGRRKKKNTCAVQHASMHMRVLLISDGPASRPFGFRPSSS